MKNPTLHLSFNKIIDVAVDRAASAEITEHLKSCPACEFDLARARGLVEVMQTDLSEDAPPSTIATVLRLFDEHHASKPPPQALGQRIRAILRLDSAMLAPAYGFRSAGAANSRQMLFTAGGGSLDIRITPTDANWIISGQALGQIAGGEVRLKGKSLEFLTDIDSHGEFALPAIPGGTYRLQLQSESFEVDFPDLVIS